MFRTISTALLLWIALVSSPAAAAAAPPSADDVFQLSVSRAADGGLVLGWAIRSGTYLYRDRISAHAADGQVVPVATEPGDVKNDPNFGPTEVYHTGTTAHIDGRDLPATGTITLTYQGCAEAGICYPPVSRIVDPASLAVSGAGFGLLAAGPVASASAATSPSADAAQVPLTVWEPKANSGDAPVAAKTSPLSGSLLAVLVGFFGVGLLLAFTPCVFPMIPILSGILAGSGERLSAGRGLMLSTSYVIAMALAYALVGAASAWGGLNLQIALQTPLALGLLAALFVVFALSMYGFFDLELPGAWTDRLTRTTSGKGDSIGGAALLGFVSALVVGPCMTPALAGALLYVAQTGDIARGAGALFVMGLGLGVPLIVFGTFGGRFLPRAGAWLAQVKQASAFVFLGLAVWLLARIVPASVALALWGAIAILAGIWLAALAVGSNRVRPSRLLAPMAGGGAVLAGLLLLGTAAFPAVLLDLVPAPRADGSQTVAGFTRTVTDTTEFDAALAEARRLNQPILVDFTAQWCLTCREIEANVFEDPAIRVRLAGISVIRADLSVYAAKGQALMQRFGVAGPPTLFLLDPESGREPGDARVVGPLSAKEFARLLDRAGA